MNSRVASFLVGRNLYLNSLYAFIVLIAFRLFLLPNTVPASLDQWHDVQANHFGLPTAFTATIILIAVVVIVLTMYLPLVEEYEHSRGLWLVTALWLGVICFSMVIMHERTLILNRESSLLLGYSVGLLAARMFRRLDTYASALVVCGALQSIISIFYQTKGINTLVSGHVIRAGGIFNTPNDLFMIPLFILPLAINKIISAKHAFYMAAYMLCSCCMLATLILTWQRSGFLAVGIGLFWLLRQYMTSKRQIVACALILALVIAVFTVRSYGPVNYASSMRSIHAREYLFDAGIMTFSHHFINGIGIGCLTLPVPVLIHSVSVNIQIMQPCNQFLYMLDEMGIFGGVLIVIFFFFTAKILRYSSTAISRSVGAIWISVLVAGMFNTLFGCYDFSCGNMLIGSLIGMTLRLQSDAKHDKSPELRQAI